MTFFVEGVPCQQGSKNAGITKAGRAFMWEKKSAKLKRWRAAVEAEARRAMGNAEPIEGPVSLAIEFRMPRGKSVKRPLPWVAPDLDKLVRAVGDALTGVVYGDDSRIVAIDARKLYEDERGPGARVTVSEVDV